MEKNKLEKTESEYLEVITSLKNLRQKLLKEIRELDDILNYQSTTIFNSKDYYEAQRYEKMKLSATICNIANREWNIDENGEIVK